MSKIQNIANINLNRRQAITLGLGSIATLGLAACSSGGSGSKDDSSSSASSSASKGSSGKKKAIFGTEGTYAPYTYVDDSGKLTGFDIELTRAIGEQIEGYDFDFSQLQWDGIFAALDAGKIDSIANEVAKNKEREAKYIFSEKPFSWSANAIVFKKGRTDIKTIKDLYGKVVDAGTTSANTAWLEDYNKKNGNPINIQYTDGDVNKMFQDIVNGRADATLNSPVTAKNVIDTQGLDLDYVLWLDEGITPVYYPFRNDDSGKALKKALDPVLNDLLEDGTVKKLSEQFLGADYSTKDSVQNLADSQQAS